MIGKGRFQKIIMQDSISDTKGKKGNKNADSRQVLTFDNILILISSRFRLNAQNPNDKCVQQLGKFYSIIIKSK